MENLLKRRFQELTDQAEKLEASKCMEADSFTNERQEEIDSNALLNWKVKAMSLLQSACGAESQHFKHFEKSSHSMYSTNLKDLKRMKAVFQAAQEDYNGGYLPLFTIWFGRKSLNLSLSKRSNC